jgi:hypothetical protein
VRKEEEGEGREGKGKTKGGILHLPHRAPLHLILVRASLLPSPLALPPPPPPPDHHHSVVEAEKATPQAAVSPSLPPSLPRRRIPC